MKKLLKKVVMCATMMAALVGFSSCEDDLDRGSRDFLCQSELNFV